MCAVAVIVSGAVALFSLVLLARSEGQRRWERAWLAEVVDDLRPSERELADEPVAVDDELEPEPAQHDVDRWPIAEPVSVGELQARLNRTAAERRPKAGRPVTEGRAETTAEFAVVERQRLGPRPRGRRS